MQRLERPYVGRSHHDHSPRVLEPELEPLLSLDPLDDPVRLHDLHRVRVRPRPDSDPVPPDHDPAARARGDAGRSIRRRQLQIRSGRSGVQAEGLGEFGGGAKRRRVEVGCGGGEEEEEDEAREAVAEYEADEAAEAMEDQPEDRRRGLDGAVR